MAAPNKRKPTPQRTAEKNRLSPVLEQFAGHKVMRLLGYWALVQTYGGWEGLAAQPFWPEGSVQRWRLEFREVFRCEAEDYVPEVGPVLHSAFYGDGETHRTPAGKRAQADAAVILAAEVAAGKVPRTPGRATRGRPVDRTLHDALGTEKA